MSDLINEAGNDVSVDSISSEDEVSDLVSDDVVSDADDVVSDADDVVVDSVSSEDEVSDLVSDDVVSDADDVVSDADDVVVDSVSSEDEVSDLVSDDVVVDSVSNDEAVNDVSNDDVADLVSDEGVMSDLINVSNISISFTQYVKGLNQRELKVITDLTLDIKEGEIVAVLGSSGSGKSLLAHAILGILPSNANLSGTMMYKGEVMTEELKAKLRGDEISLIPQSVNFLDPLMKVSDQVIGECKDEAEEKEKRAKQRAVFEKYNLSEEVDGMYPFQLSGGMARRVLVSTALLSNPKLVIADEPTPGLDEKSVEETLNYLRQMAADNVGVLLITHDIDAALKVANRIAIFYSGYVIEIANASDFSADGENLLHPYTKSLFKALPHNGFELTRGHQPLHGEIPLGCPYYDRCSHKLEKCDKVRPDLIPIDEKKRVRCFKYGE